MTCDSTHSAGVSEPYDGYLNHVSAQIERDRVAARPPTCEFSGADPALHVRIDEIVEELRAPLCALAADLHAHPETAFQEHRSIQVITELLERYDLPVTLGAGGVETAASSEFKGEEEAGARRTVGIISEYDALPDIGHACGHNVIAAAGVGAYIALALLHKRYSGSVPGVVRWLGTPAEEGHSGKEYMARGGAFDGLDAALMIHPYGYDVVNQVWLGRRVLSVTFTGRAAHASAQPFMGRNALDAATLAYQAIGLLRQQMLPVDRIHAIMPEGGQRASVIAETARLSMYVRSKYPDTLRDLSARVEDICHGAALMTGCAVSLEWDEHPPSLPVLSNRLLEARFATAMARRGRTMLPAGIVPETIAASTDFGNISYRVPAIHPLVKIASESTALHTVEFAQAAASEAADNAVADAAVALASTALDFLSDDALAQGIAAEFTEAGGPVDVPSYFDPQETP